MKDFKKTLITLALFVVFLGFLSFLVIRPYNNSAYATENDRSARDELAGKLDTIIAGASHAEYGINNVMMDKALGTYSYNLSGPWQNTYGTKLLLERELDRNPVKKVYLVFSEGTFAQTKVTDGIAGDAKMLPRLDGIAERTDYLFRSAAVSEYPGIYQDMVNRSFTYLKALISGEETDKVKEANRGHNPKKANNIALKKKTAASKKDKKELDTSVLPFNEENIAAAIKMCKDRGVDVKVVIVPVSDRYIWASYGWDEWYDYVKDFCARHEVSLWDFNLYRGRFALLDDKNCYRDEGHLSINGSKIFTNLLIEVIQRDEAGENVTPDFYPSYAEMEEHSPYNK